MRRTIKVITFLIAFLLIPTQSSAAQCKVTRVSDGDTVLCKMDNVSIKVRLVGIDAPETSTRKREAGQPYSQQAKKYLASLALNKVVDIKEYGLDQYNCVLGEIENHRR